jgi:phage shock protein A
MTLEEMNRRIAERDAARDAADELRRIREEDRRDEALELSMLTILRKSGAM